MKALALLTLFLHLALAHFTLDFPYTTGFDEDLEPNPPCGDYNPETSNLTAWPLVGGQIALDSHHPTMTILYRAQLMGATEWVNLTDGFIVMTGLGELCITIAKSLPSNWTNQAGVVQVIGQPPDGILYQCAGVNFTASAQGSSLCVNGTGITVGPSSTGFAISSDNVDFNGFQNVTTTPTTSGGAGASATSSTSATGKSAGSVVQVGLAIVIGAICIVLAFT